VKFSRIMDLLKQLDEYRRIATVAGHYDVSQTIVNVLEIFEREDKAEFLSRTRKPIEIDEYGRSYSTARRKESHARVWVIPTRRGESASVPAPASTESEETLDQLRASLPALQRPRKSVEQNIPVSQILINNVPLAQYLYVPHPCICRA
jgi:small subunit ribosomal protein S9